MKTILIVQSTPGWIPILVNAISARLPGIADCLVCTDNFEYALDLAPPKGELVVITSGMFHDSISEHKGRGTKNIPDSDKNGNKLAEEIKKINPGARVYVFSEFKPLKSKYLDGFIEKIKYDEMRNLPNLLEILNF